jgi:26S proteasome regulatory subunit N1
LADILSILAMTYDDDNLDTLKYRKVGSKNAIGSWGHEYVRYGFEVQGAIVSCTYTDV